MSKSKLFVSCGQRTSEERELGKQICEVIAEHGVFEPYFAEFQSNLSGLNENIIDALSTAAGIITVMHGRGAVRLGLNDESSLIRASVWVEQEIAIAAYIQRTTKRQLLTAAYIETNVGREGIRDLLILNPKRFATNDEVVADLREKLQGWQSPTKFPLASPDEDERGKIELQYSATYESGRRVVNLCPVLMNKSSRAKEYSCTLEVPSPLLNFASNTHYMVEIKSNRTDYRRFRVTEETNQQVPIQKGDSMLMFSLAVSITEILPQQRAVLLKLPIYVAAELESSAYSLEMPCSEVFASEPAAI